MTADDLTGVLEEVSYMHQAYITWNMGETTHTLDMKAHGQCTPSGSALPPHGTVTGRFWTSRRRLNAARPADAVHANRAMTN